ncbi:malto-oligosyltrehalose trehalohydrolase [Quadrisphaera sp. KR29]|uniref:malto-oligosyltrehalose trehalohydrolase n=1 Tax=Quadrisphaera sp. KR29 TaxID=3461391 RepID=UPI0040447616
MHRFAVWAPSADRVEIDVHLPSGVTTRALERTDGPAPGWWAVTVDEAGDGTDYAFRVDGGDPRPDPRSAHQPHDVHGPSRVFDPSAHAWGDQGWDGRDARGAVVYELHVGTFTPEGTLDAATAKLPHLVDLGVDVVELLPVAAFPGRRGWGYDGVDLYAVHDAYGGPAALQRFVDAAHQAGLAVALDCVYNHLGPAGNYLGEFGPYFTEEHHTPWGAAVNLDQPGSEGVRRFVVDNALRWFRDFHVDVLRLDAVHALVDDSAEHVLAQLARETAALSAEVGRPLTLIAESDLNDTGMVTPLGQASGTPLPARGMQAQWADDVHHALRSVMTGERGGYYKDFASLEVLGGVLERVFHHAGTYSPFRGKTWGAPVDTDRYRGHAFVAYTTTHDQTGNRATGDRLSASLDDAALATAQAVVLTSAFTPMIFMGEEWGATTPWMFFTDHDAELGALVSKGRAEEFASHGWEGDVEVPDPQEESTFTESKLDWSEPESARGARLLAWTRDLLALRRSEPDLAGDDLRAVRTATSGDAELREGGSPWLVARRGSLALVANLAQHELEVPLAGVLDGGDDARAEVVLAWDAAATQVRGASVRLPSRASAVVRVA